VLLVVAASLFALLADDVKSGARLTVVDAEIATWLHRQATPSLVTAMLLWTQLHSTVAVGAYAAIATLVLAVERSWRRATLVVIAVGGGLALNALMKLAFHRTRPSFDDPLLTLETYSFPSGHVAGSTIFYGLVVVAVFARTTSARWRALVLIAALLAVALVAFSRMLLGAHYLSDVLAAFVEGIAWLAISVGALAALWRDAPRAHAAEPA
jgi:undecaprenyl-diphosphatase